MPRFDVFAYDNPTIPLVLDVQADALNQLVTRAVVPLIPADSHIYEPVLPRLKPLLHINDVSYVLATPDITTLPLTELGPCLTNLANRYHHDIVQALDMLFHGF